MLLMDIAGKNNILASANNVEAMMPTDLGEQFRAAMRRFPSTVSVISTAKDGRRHGMTAPTVTSGLRQPQRQAVRHDGELSKILRERTSRGARGCLAKFCRARLSRPLRLWRMVR